MSGSLVQTLFRCGVCFEMFGSSEECYDHIITHEVDQTTEEETQTVQSDAGTATDNTSEETASSTAEVVPQEQKVEPEVLNVISMKDDGTQANVESIGYSPDVAIAPSSKSEVVGVLQSVEDGAMTVGTDQSGLWANKVGEVLEVHQLGGKNTHEDLDIADILINIKQEKPDEVVEEHAAVAGEMEGVSTQDLDKLTSQVAQTNKGQDTESSPVVKPKTVKKKKKAKVTKAPIVKQEKPDEIPVVRRKKRGEKNQIEEDDDGVSYACDVCGKRYAILKSLKYHLRTHDHENLHYCDICGRGFVKPSELTNHQKIHDSSKDSKDKDGDGDGDMFKCPYCDKEYSIEKSLKHHVKVHELGNRYTCTTCDRNFFKPSDLERHKSVHKPLSKCYICKKPFRDPKKLEAHVRMHPEILLQDDKALVKSGNLMQCKYCNKKCSTFSQLCNHVRTHTKKKPFPCDVCGKMFNRISNMRLHRKLHSGKKPYRCDPCSIAFADIANFKRHMKKYHGGESWIDVNYKPRCSKVTVVDDLPPAPKLRVQRETLVNELRSAYEELETGKDTEVNLGMQLMKSPEQKGKNLVQCREVMGIPREVQQMISVGSDQIQVPKTLGGSSVNVPEGGSEQVYVVFEDNPSICYVLEYEGDKAHGKLAGSQVKVPDQIILTEEAEKMLEEPQPGQGTSEVQENAEDMEDEDCVLLSPEDPGSDAEITPASSNKKDAPGYIKLKRYVCSVCNLGFKHHGSLKFHYKKHTKEGVMHCEICKAEFYRKSRLRIHMRDHTGERPYECSECKLTFKVHYDLTVHMRTHTGFGAMQCDHCDKIFYTKRALNAHLRNQSKEKPYSCRVCGKLFKRKDQRRRHMLVHYGNLPFQCHLCERSFGDSSNRKRHIIKTHGEDALGSLPKGRVSLVKNVTLSEAGC